MLAVLLPVLAAAGCAPTGDDSALPAPVSAGPILSDPKASAPTPTVSAPATPALSPNVPLYLVDVNTTNDLGLTLPTGVLAGVRGTIPGAPLADSFRESLHQFDPALGSDAFAAEAYDAVVLAALAAATTSDAGHDMAGRLVALTNGDQECAGFGACLSLLEGGSTISYQGRSGRLAFAPSGEPSLATIGLYTFGPDNQLLPEVEFTDVPVDTPRRTSTAPRGVAEQTGAGDGVLTIGTLLPASGSLALLRSAQLSGVEMAVRDIEADGGIPGLDHVAVVDADAGDDTQTATAGLRELLKKRVDVIVGVGAATTAGGVVPAATSAGVLYFAPVNSALTAVDDRYDGLYWRVSPSSLAQGAFLGEHIVADGHERVAIIHSDDGYAASLAQAVARSVTKAGARVVASVGYRVGAVDFAAPVAKVKKSDPDAIVLIGFDESAQVVFELVQQGIGPNSAR